MKFTLTVFSKKIGGGGGGRGQIGHFGPKNDTWAKLRIHF